MFIMQIIQSNLTCQLARVSETIFKHSFFLGGVRYLRSTGSSLNKDLRFQSYPEGTEYPLEHGAQIDCF